MAKDQIGYNRLVEKALRGVVREALERAALEGMPGGHHFYVSFRTADPGVAIPDFLKQKFPEEMTIVLQHQYWGLAVDAEAFEVTLSFSRARHTLHVPFRALTGFFDPSVQFGLQFQAADTVEGQGVTLEGSPVRTMGPAMRRPAAAEDTPAARSAGGTPPAALPKPEAGPEGPPADDAGKVVALDRFRKKT